VLFYKSDVYCSKDLAFLCATLARVRVYDSGDCTTLRGIPTCMTVPGLLANYRQVLDDFQVPAVPEIRSFAHFRFTLKPGELQRDWSAVLTVSRVFSRAVLRAVSCMCAVCSAVLHAPSHVHQAVQQSECAV
jgi:hypothetical protein